MTSPAVVTLHKVSKDNSAVTIPHLLQLIKALALFEKAPESVDATEELLKRNLLGVGDERLAGKYAECVLAYVDGEPETGGKPVGMAVYFYNFSTWTGKGGLYLEDLFVAEAYRKLGIGKVLFQHLGQICKEKDLARLEWVVLDWNEEAKKVYRKMGAEPKKEWEGMRLEGDALAKLAQ